MHCWVLLFSNAAHMRNFACFAKLLPGAHCFFVQVVLLGDAAHTITPALGQGLNAGLEDVAVFAQILEEHQGDVDTALLAYNKARLPDVQAIMTINEVVSSADAGLACQVSNPFLIYWVLQVSHA